ncbi:ribonuclease T2 family protein [Amaricoccus sp. W119]|uniref:ribonuclease T2 family protein n=1 Tax=Amaricoccus sp. W119 TaxID=3391833 RepID=UPI0039A771CE
MIKGLRRPAASNLLAGLLIAGAMTAPAGPARAQPAGDFDYYVLALSWSPTWCANEVAAGDPPEQCAPERKLGFTLHGLWPQYADGGWPEYCDTHARDPSRGQSAAMSDIMGSRGLAWYQWKKHGRCSGLAADDYYGLSRRAFERISLPEIGGEMLANVIEFDFIAQNPWLQPDDLIVTCADGKLREVRICLSRDLEPQACARDVQEDGCRGDRPLTIPPIP